MGEREGWTGRYINREGREGGGKERNRERRGGGEGNREGREGGGERERGIIMGERESGVL